MTDNELVKSLKEIKSKKIPDLVYKIEDRDHSLMIVTVFRKNSSDVLLSVVVPFGTPKESD